jgi:hypothetical protein
MSERAQRDPVERDRTLSRVRTTTAVTGIGAVLAGGALVGWLNHATGDEASTSTSTSTGTDDSTTSSSSDDGLTSPTTSPESGSSDSSSDQPGVTSGGS